MTPNETLYRQADKAPVGGTAILTKKQVGMELEAVQKLIATPVDIEPTNGPELGVYTGNFEVEGTVTVHALRRHMRADLVSEDDPFERLLQKAAAAGGAIELSISDFMLREHSPGKLLGASGYGRIEARSGNWIIPRCANTGSRGGEGDKTIYIFRVDELAIFGPAVGRDVAAVRRVFEGSEISRRSRIGGNELILKALTNDAEQPEDELTSAITIGTLDEVQELSLLYGLSFISGNRINTLLSDTFDVAGDRIEIRHRRGSGMSDGRNAPFHIHYGWITPEGMEQIFDGFTRLHRAGFPIEMVVHHLTEANTNNLDIDAQHLTLAIHTAIEAWNRLFGVDLWIDDEIWEEWFELLRRHILRPALRPAYDDIGNEVISNMWSVGRHANRSLTSWRQRQFFNAMTIDVRDEDTKRVLAMRDELLHNGYFLRRFQQLTPEEQQQRIDDIARLRNLAHTITFHLAGFSGECFDFLKHHKRSIAPLTLPDQIRNQAN